MTRWPYRPWKASLLALLLASTVTAGACGTRVDRAAFYASLQRSAAAQASGGPGDQTAPEAGTATGAPGAPTATTANAAVRAATTTKPTTAAATASRLGLSTQVVGDTIRIGIHVPITGAAPIPTDFMASINAAQDYINNEAPIDGRKVKISVEDDGYDAQIGLAACKKLASEDPLLVIGHTMPAAEDACADYFQQQKIPYFVRGTYPEVLNNRPLAWFATTDDTRQGQLLADYILHQMGAAAKKSAVVYQNDQTAAKAAFVARIEGAGGRIVAAEQSVPRQSDYGATVQKLQSAGAEFVLLSMPPVDAIKLSTQAQGQGYHPTWLGGGTWWNYNMVLESAGAALDGAIALSPWASVDSAAADQFKAVYQKYRPGEDPPDYGLVMYGWIELIRAMCDKAGGQLSRNSLVAGLDDFTFSVPFWVPIHFTTAEHHGATAVAVFRADGQAKRWRQISGFTASL